jgi:hypothetical protein
MTKAIVIHRQEAPKFYSGKTSTRVRPNPAKRWSGTRRWGRRRQSSNRADLCPQGGQAGPHGSGGQKDPGVDGAKGVRAFVSTKPNGQESEACHYRAASPSSSV